MRGLTTGPVGDDEALRLLKPALEAGPALLAVSGGPDSTALMGLAAAVRPSCDASGLIAVTVDHGLRAEARAEAEATGALARRLGFEHVILSWQGAKPATGLQEAARQARYGLMAEFAAKRGISRILLAHTLDDQAETVLMRLIAGSGIRGLAGMRSVSERGALSLSRPFLSVRKARLVATCTARGWPFATDPSNQNAAFLRPRLRGLLPLLAAEGLTAERLAVLARRAGEADQLIEAVTRRALAASDAALGGRKGATSALHAPMLFDHGREQAVRMLGYVVGEQHGHADAPVPLDKLESLVARLMRARATGARCVATLAGTKVVLDGDVVRFSPAPPRRKLS